jgi:hypothetical protein
MPARSEALAAKRRNIVQAHIEAEASTHDVAAALRTFHHPRYEVPALAAIADGSEAVTGLLNALLAAFSDFFFASTPSTRRKTPSSSNALLVAHSKVCGPACRLPENAWKSRLRSSSYSKAKT